MNSTMTTDMVELHENLYICTVFNISLKALDTIGNYSKQLLA